MEKLENQIFSSYQRNPSLYDEIFDEKGDVKAVYRRLFELYGAHSIQDYVKLNEKAKSSFFNQGITFQVYGGKESQEKIFPFDLFPRIIDTDEWDIIERGPYSAVKRSIFFSGISTMKKKSSVRESCPWN